MQNKPDLESIISPLYLVGGSVRNALLGISATDLDYATPLSPDEIEAAIRKAGKKPYLVGKRFGTVGLKWLGMPVEITTFRTESYSPGSRKPKVQFVTDIMEDLSRRDFTINAMAKRGEELLDPFGGQKDLQQKIIRAVGTPKLRFAEDPLRLLRAARFAAQFNFAIEPATIEAITAQAHSILEVSKERWGQELDKLLLTKKPGIGLLILADTRILNFILPELSLQIGYNQNSPYHTYPLWQHTVKVVEATPQDITLRWAALLHDIAKPFVKTNKHDRSNYIHHDVLGAEFVTKLGIYLRWPRVRTEAVRSIVLNHLDKESPLRPFDNAAK